VPGLSRLRSMRQMFPEGGPRAPDVETVGAHRIQEGQADREVDAGETPADPIAGRCDLQAAQAVEPDAQQTLILMFY